MAPRTRALNAYDGTAYDGTAYDGTADGGDETQNTELPHESEVSDEASEQDR